jgi:EEF1A N-terminal glycine/lysine methyltransferase
MLELDRMKDMMDKMEQERAEMVAEVEAQIERALASMAVDIDSDYGSSRPHSRLSNVSGPLSRRPSDAAKSRQLRSFGTETTLAESYGDEIEAMEESSTADKPDRENAIIEEVEEEDITLTRRKRFSASEMDGMNAVDEGISQKSDKIAQKVLEIQQKVCEDVYSSFGFALIFHSWKRR